MLKATESIFPTGNSYLLFQHWENFGRCSGLRNHMSLCFKQLIAEPNPVHF